ncbi:hypothetical protein A3E33_02645 [Candidatus Nomurabacteria bacterium RIFCSPHIGHO2_12_FULL_40_77]|nr:MAG: hypothetical protein A3E33_02645 [Candidatus Nomurabacteria bacterium RIFCSPHIGHO2_12_FULL_40_77]
MPSLEKALPVLNNCSETVSTTKQLVRVDDNSHRQKYFVKSTIDEAYEMELVVLRRVELGRKGA